MPDDTFTILSDRIGLLELGAGELRLKLDDNPRQQLHRLGFADAPLYEIDQPFAPDDGWTVRRLEGGRRTANTEPSAAVRRCVHEERSARLLAALPAGRYLTVRSPRALQADQRVLLGNAWNPPRADMLALRGERPFFAYAVGAQSPAQPRGPLIGVVILHSNGTRHTHELLCFAFDDGPSDEEPLLVLPVTGELILDSYMGFGREREQQAREAWRAHWADPCARWLAGEDAAFPTPSPG